MSLVQNAHCNGNCGFHGLKVNAVLQADRIRHTHSDSLRRYYYVSLYRSSMIKMIRELNAGDDLRAPKVSFYSDHDRKEEY